MKILAPVLTATTLVLTASLPAEADQPVSPEYVANIRQHIVFLEQASRLAGSRAANEQVRSFAQSEAAELKGAADDLKGWEAQSPTGGLASPQSVASLDEGGMSTSSDGLVTGRSVAIDDDDGAGVLMASPGVLVMPRLATINGEAFDTLFKATQISSLTELEALYDAYAKTGDDPTLRAMAIRELPVVRQQIVKLQAL